MDERNQHAEDWIDVCRDNDHRLTPWEIDFIKSISVQVSNRRILSEKQLDTLERIYSKV